jgi:hypothetical protein
MDILIFASVSYFFGGLLSPFRLLEPFITSSTKQSKNLGFRERASYKEFP